MSKLLQRMQDASRSGVYRASRDDEILDALRGAPLEVARISFAGGDDLFATFARALRFPDWFGRNWDALEDCLTDRNRVLLIEYPRSGDDFGALVDVLGAVAQYWAGQGKPFFAVFLDPQRRLELPPLYRDA